MKLVRQHDDRDCGAACLAMISLHFGRRLPLPEARRITHTGQDGANMYGLVTGAESLGLQAAGLAGTLDELLESVSSGEVGLPFIAHVRENSMLHYVVVTKIDRVVHIADPARGRRQLSSEEFGRIWTGHLVAPRLTRPLEPAPAALNAGYPFLALLKGQRRWIVGVLILSLLLSAIGTVGAFSFQIVIDGSSPGFESDTSGQDSASVSSILSSGAAHLADWSGLSLVAIVFGSLILLYLLQAAIQFLRGWIIILVSKRIDAKLLLAYFDHIVDLPVSSVHLRKTGEYMSRLADAAAIRAAISGAAVSLVLDSTMVVATAVILYLQGGMLFWLAFAMVGIYVLLVFAYRRPIERRSRAAMEKDAVVQSYVKESLDGIETVKASGAGGFVKHSARRKLFGMIDATAREGMVAVSQDAVSDAVQVIGTTVILWSGFTMVTGGQMSVGELMTFYALLGFFVQPVRNLVDLQPAIQAAFVAASRLNDIFMLEVEESAAGLELEHRVGEWSVNGVDFRYGNGDLALKDVSLKVTRGERIGVVGESGSGKTTLARLLLRFHEPEHGDLTAGGVDLRRVRLADLRRSIAYVDQKTFLFADSIANNLRLGSSDDPDVDDVALREACDRAQISDHIASLPMGFDTALDEGGNNLSGGQRQRLAIARALLKSPDLLILDEATSNLDTTTEARLWDSLFALQDLTFVVVAHRLAAVRRCDRIYVLQSGEVVESGSHDHLLALDGVYAELWANQIGSPAPASG